MHKIVSIAAAVALVVPAAVVAKKPADAGSKGKGQSHAKKGKGKGHAKPKMHVFKGTWNDEAGGVDVTGGNKRAREYKGTTVVFDLTNAKIKVADVDLDGDMDADDVQQGDEVLVQAKLAKDAAQPFAARKLIDQTNPAPEDEDEDEDEVEAEPTAEPTVTPDAE